MSSRIVGLRLVTWHRSGDPGVQMSLPDKTNKAKRGKAPLDPVVRRAIERLNEVIKERGTTPTAIARATGLSQGNLSRVLRFGSASVSFEIIVAVAKHLELSLDGLVVGAPRLNWTHAETGPAITERDRAWLAVALPLKGISRDAANDVAWEMVASHSRQQPADLLEAAVRVARLNEAERRGELPPAAPEEPTPLRLKPEAKPRPVRPR